MDRRDKNSGNKIVVRGRQTKSARRGRTIGEKRKGLIATRRNRRFGQTVNRRNRLERVQAASRNINNRNNGNRRLNRIRRFRRTGFNQRSNLVRRKLFVGGLHRSITNRWLYRLFRKEGRIVFCNVIYDRFGNSKGFGILEFAYPRDALRAIQKWNNTEYMGNYLRIGYKRKRNNRRFDNRRRDFDFGPNYGNRNFNQYPNRNNQIKFRGRGRGRGFRGGYRNNYY